MDSKIADNHGKKMQERRRLLHDLDRAGKGAELSPHARNRLVRLGLGVRGDRRDTLTDLGRKLLDEGVHSEWFVENEPRLTRKGGG